MTVPQAEVLGLTLPDPELRWNERARPLRLRRDRLHRAVRGHQGQRPVQRAADRAPPPRPRRRRLGPRGRRAPTPTSSGRAARARRPCGMSDRPRTGRCWEVFVRAARPQPHARRQPARARRRDGAAQRPRPLHPPPGGRVDLGRPGRRRSPRAARTRRTRSSTRPPTRSTGTRRSTTSPRGSSTCERRPRDDLSTLRRSALRPTTRWSRAQRMGEWIAAAPQLEEDVALGNIALDLLGQARALLTYAGEVEGAGRDEDDAGLPARRARVPQRASSSSCRTATSASRSRGCWSSRRTSTSCTAALQRVDRRDARGRRGQGGQGGRLPPRPRDPVDAAARRRHRRVAPADAGGPRRRVAVRRRAVRVRRRWSRGWSRDGVAVDPAALERAGPGVRRRRARRGDADPAPDRRPPHAAAAAASTPSTWATCSPRCSTSPARTRGRRGERDRPTLAHRGRAWRGRRGRCSTPRCRC